MMSLNKFFLLTLFISLSAHSEPDCKNCKEDTILETSKPIQETSGIEMAEELINKLNYKDMLSKPRCELFNKTLNNIKKDFHLLPSKALFDSLAYYFEHKNKSPISKKGKELLESSKEFVRIAKACKKYKTIKWEGKDGGIYKKACKFYRKNKGFHQQLIKDHESKITSSMISIGNFDVDSSMKRFFVINTETGEVSSSKVSHGKGRGNGTNRSAKLRKCIATNQKRVKDSGPTKDQTRPGFYRVTSRATKGKSPKYSGHFLVDGWPKACHQGVYNPKSRRRSCGKGNKKSLFNSIRLVGLEKSNSDAYESGVIMHGAHYNQPTPEGWGYSGTSHGCPAFSYKDFENIAQSISSHDHDEQNSSLYYSYAPICGGIQKDEEKRTSRIYKEKKKLTKSHKKIVKKLKKTLGREYLENFQEALESDDYFYQPFNGVTKKHAKNWGAKLHKKTPLSTLEYLQKLKSHLEDRAKRSNNEDLALKYINSKLKNILTPKKNDESFFIREYLEICKKYK